MHVFYPIFIIPLLIWGSNEQKTDVAPVALLKEGSVITEASGTMVRLHKNDVILFQIDSTDKKDGTNSLVVLPNKRLEEIELALQEDENSDFLISGDVYLYKNENYLLISGALLVESFAPRNNPTFEPINPNAESLPEGMDDDSIDDIVRELEEAVGPIVKSIRLSKKFPKKNGMKEKSKTRINSRRCLLSRSSEGAWIANFVSVDSKTNETPCIILPGEEFARLTKWAGGNDSTTPVLLTGKITNYHGHSFLVLDYWRKVHQTDHLPF